MDVSSNQKNNIYDFSLQTGQEEISQSCKERPVDSLNPNTSAVLTTFAFVPDNLEKERERLKEEFFNLKTKLQEMEQENKNPKFFFSVTMYCLLVKYAVIMQAFQI